MPDLFPGVDSHFCPFPLQGSPGAEGSPGRDGAPGAKVSDHATHQAGLWFAPGPIPDWTLHLRLTPRPLSSLFLRVIVVRLAPLAPLVPLVLLVLLALLALLARVANVVRL